MPSKQTTPKTDSQPPNQPPNQPSAQPLMRLFDRDLVIARRLRAARARASGKAEHFLLPRLCEDMAERILDINRSFKHVLILGPADFANGLTALLEQKGAGDKLEKVTLAAPDLDEESLPYRAANFDLILSGLTLHSVNDLPGTLLQIERALRPDGLFIGALFGGQTLTELRQSLYRADEQLYGGVNARIAPMADFQQLAGLLQRAGFALPVVDTDRVNVRYSNPMRLLADLRGMGETNALMARSRKTTTLRFFMSAAKHYANEFVDDEGKVPATFEILWLTGWKKHDSQQKPLRPGSAKMRLADALGTAEKRL